ncbi:11362_t:CDS:1 [Diversispora eburnea]|uniref:11362_t:CDS:1 n=1 Tax=Diversispora eburnea TaxID=1213867 RepID=A0A9N8V0N8_9GLOM|nr:11362_t:CDS:1 [Diversispora eburnea]
MASTYIPSSPNQNCVTVCIDDSSEDEYSQHEEEYHNQNSHRKSVQFSRFNVIYETWCNDEYDRTSMEPARLSFKEYSELLQLRCDLQSEMRKMMKAAENQQNSNNQNHQDNHVQCLQ